MPLVVGPAIAAAGFALLARGGTGGSYWTTFLLPIVVLGLGMAVTVAPLTTSVINAVPVRQAGVAAGINNAVASVANLLAVAVFGAIALSAFNHALDHRLTTQPMTPEVRMTVEGARGKFVTDTAAANLQAGDRATAEAAIRESLAESIRLVMWLAAALALAGAVCAALTIRPASAPAPQGLIVLEVSVFELEIRNPFLGQALSGHYPQEDRAMTDIPRTQRRRDPDHDRQAAADNQDEVLNLMIERARFMATQPGFVSVNLHRSKDGSHVVNYINGPTRKSEAAHHSPEFRKKWPRFGRARR